MIKVEYGMVKDKLWLYYGEDGESQPVEVMVTQVQHKAVHLSNGDVIPTDRFYEVCEPATDDSPEAQQENMVYNEGQEQQNLGGPGGSMLNMNDIDLGENADPDKMMKALMGNVEFDEFGIPKAVKNAETEPGVAPVKARGGNQQQPKRIDHHNQPIHQPISSPLISLIERGQFKNKSLFIPLDIPIIDKTLFNVLLDTYPDEEIEILLEHLVSKIGIDKIKEAVKLKMRAHYGAKPAIKTDEPQ